MTRTQGVSAVRIAAALGLALVTMSGCATKGFVRSEVAGAKTYTDDQINPVRTEVGEVRAKADAAATLADQLANGSYSEVSSHQVQFAFDDYQLDADAQGMLDQLATELTAHPRYVLEIRGFADAKGTDRYNYRLGRERADEVLRYMMTKHEVSSNRAAIVSFGEGSPIADNESEEGRAQNRRVQVRLLELKSTGTPVSSNM